MRGAKSTSSVSVEEFIEMDVVVEVRVEVHVRVPAVGRATSGAVTSEYTDTDDTVLDVFGYLQKRFVVAAIGEALDLELLVVVLVKPLKRLDEDEVNGKPCGL